MSDKADAVRTAVINQLIDDERPSGDLSKVMGGDLHYGKYSMANFLYGVRQQLLKVGYDFHFDDKLNAQAQGMTVQQLIDAIVAMI